MSDNMSNSDVTHLDKLLQDALSELKTCSPEEVLAVLATCTELLGKILRDAGLPFVTVAEMEKVTQERDVARAGLGQVSGTIKRQQEQILMLDRVITEASFAVLDALNPGRVARARWLQAHPSGSGATVIWLAVKAAVWRWTVRGRYRRFLLYLDRLLSESGVVMPKRK